MGKYKLYPNGGTPPPISSGDEIRSLAKDTAFDRFVAALPNRELVLASKPDAQTKTCLVDNEDDLIKWLLRIDTKPSISFTFADTQDGQPLQLQSSQINLSLPTSLTFTTIAKDLDDAFGDSGKLVKPAGLAPEGQWLVFALSAATVSITVSVVDLFDAAGVLEMSEHVPDLLLKAAVTLKPGPGRRNGLWLAPAHETVVRLQFQFDALTEVQKLIGDTLKGLTITAADAICKQHWALASTSDGIKAIPLGEVSLSLQSTIPPEEGSTVVPEFDIGVTMTQSAMTLTFLVKASSGAANATETNSAEKDTKTPAFSAIVGWLGGLVSQDSAALKKFLQSVLTKDSIFSRIHIRRLIVRLDTSVNRNSPTLDSVSFDIEVPTTSIGQPKNSKSTVVFLLSYLWSKDTGGTGSIVGKLWTDKTIPLPWSLAPFLEPWDVLVPETKDVAEFIELASIIPGQSIDHFPDIIPDRMTSAYISLSSDRFSVGGRVVTKRDAAGQPLQSGVPQPPIGEVTLDAFYSWGEAKDFSLRFAVVVRLPPGDSAVEEHHPGATLCGSLIYMSPTTGARYWRFKASVSNLYASSLAGFFEEEERKHIMPLVNAIVLEQLTVDYTYTMSNTKVSASSFVINGVMNIAQLKLRLDFTHSGTGWQFDAKIIPQSAKAKLGDVLHSLLGESSLDLPDIISNMEIIADGKDEKVLAFRVGWKPPAVMNAGSVDPDRPTIPVAKFFYLVAEIHIAKLRLTFAQIHSTDWGPKAPSKRLFRADLDLTGVRNIDMDLVGHLELPVDDIFYLWAQDPAQVQAKPAATGDPMPTPTVGITRLDLEQLNTVLDTNKILVKDQFKAHTPGDLLIATGSSFGVIGIDSSGQRSCILSYEFGKPTAQEKETDGENSGGGTVKPDPNLPPVDGGTNGNKAGDDNNPSTHAPMKKKAGPLSVSNVGLKYQGKLLSIILDANFELGPLAFALLGFSIDLSFTTLDQVPKPSFSLEGMSAAFDKPPVGIAGIIRRGKSDRMSYYAGGLIVSYIPYQFMAAGFYGTVPASSTNKAYTSVFVFARLDGPLVSLEFAEISGLTGGFGYNSNARLPAIEDVTKYPLVAPISLNDAGDALKTLQTLTQAKDGWFSPMDKTYWAAAGLKVDALQMVSIDAVVLVQFGNGTVKLSIFAVAVADIPTAASPVKMAHVELGMSLTVDPAYGILKVEAQLAPGSFILAPDCHLTGGMALVYWFDGPHAETQNVGQFLFTIGGYHAGMNVPPGWPKPPRLGISWNVGTALSVSGEAYFAVTPKVCMAGMRLHASFSDGPIGAWFDAFADFLINYKPFHFTGHVKVTIGVSFNIDFLFVHTHVSAEIGAELNLWGPPVAGTVHVDLWVTSFTIDFGAQPSDMVERINLYQMYLQVLPAALRTAAGFSQADEEKQVQRPDNEGHSFVVTSGLLNADENPHKPPNAPWKVKGGLLCFVAECKMPVSHVRLMTPTTDKDKPVPKDVEFKTRRNTDAGRAGTQTVVQPPGIYAKPMQLENPMTSELTVTCSFGEKELETRWQLEMVTKSMPSGLWAQYTSAMDPNSKDPKGKEALLIPRDGSVPLMMGLRFIAPKPERSRDPFHHFDVADASLTNITADRHFPSSQPAHKQLFAPVKSKEDELPPISDTVMDDDVQRDAAEEKRRDAIAKQYDLVHNSWVKPQWNPGDVRSFVDVWQGALGWTGSSTELSGLAAVPKRVAKQFDTLYVAPPLYCNFAVDAV